MDDDIDAELVCECGGTITSTIRFVSPDQVFTCCDPCTEFYLSVLDGMGALYHCEAQEGQWGRGDHG